MRVLVCGGRNYANRRQVETALSTLRRLLPDEDITIVHGAARGADSLAGNVALEMGLDVEAYPAAWDAHGRAAGPIRNQQMLDTGIDLTIAFAGGRGTEDMVRRCTTAGVPVTLIDW